MKKILVSGMLIGTLIIGSFKFDSILIGTMKAVDTIGNVTGMDVSNTIDNLNELWYDLYE